MKPRSNYDTQGYKCNEPGGGEELVELDGYVPLQQMVQQYMSGVRVPGVSVYYDDNYDPTRQRDFDLADYSRLTAETQRSYDEAQAQINQHRINNAKRQGGPPPPTDPATPPGSQPGNLPPT